MITSVLLKNVVNVTVDDNFVCKQLGLSNSNLSNTLSFVDDEKYISEINSNENIVAVFTNNNISIQISPKKKILITEDPRWAYFVLFNYLAKNNRKLFDTKIADKSLIHETAYVAKKNVIIGDGTIVGPNVSILEDVEIGNNCIIQAGTVIGAEGFEYKRTSKGIIPVFHDGKVIIGHNVDIGANTCIDKGFNYRNTIIENDVKIDNLVHVAHAVLIKKGAFVIASSMLAGSCVIGENAWVGPNATIGHVILKNNANVTFGSVVTRDVEEGQKVTGNFAIPHHKFIENLKKDNNRI